MQRDFGSTALRVLVALIAATGIRAANAQPAPIAIDDTNVFPESLDAAADGTLYVGSLEKGII